MLAEIERLKQDIRREKIASILSLVPYKTDEHRKKVLELFNSDLSIDSIREMCEDIINSKKNINRETRLPQKNGLEKENRVSYID
jgi:hypothetical protein